jgi:hypothetical protein
VDENALMIVPGGNISEPDGSDGLVVSSRRLLGNIRWALLLLGKIPLCVELNRPPYPQNCSHALAVQGALDIDHPVVGAGGARSASCKPPPPQGPRPSLAAR